jgi:hypothetical protein
MIKCSVVSKEHIVLNWFRWVLKKCSGRKYISFVGRFEGLKASHSYRTGRRCYCEPVRPENSRNSLFRASGSGK